jgi:transposase
MNRQQSLITLDDFMVIKPFTKLEAILSFIDMTLFNQLFTFNPHKRGPKGYDKESLFKALIGMQVSQIPTIKELVNRLHCDPVFKCICGFEYTKTPSTSTFSIFIEVLSKTNVLERTYRRMMTKARTLGLIDASNVAIDASKINAYEHAIPKTKIPENNPSHPNWGGKLDTNGNFIKWFGWKMHALVDTVSGLPISYIITPANIADMDVALPLIEKMKDDYNGIFQPNYYLMDAGYDKPEIYQTIYQTYKGQAIIPLNWRNTKVPPDGVNFDGQLICPMNFPYVYGGNDNGTIRLLCPHVKGKCDCPMGSTWCTSAKSGYVGKARIKENPRFITTPFRGTDKYQKLYNERTSVERTFGDLKENYAVDNLRVATMKKAKLFMDISCISLLADRLFKASELIKVA